LVSASSLLKHKVVALPFYLPWVAGWSNLRKDRDLEAGYRHIGEKDR